MLESLKIIFLRSKTRQQRNNSLLKLVCFRKVDKILHQILLVLLTEGLLELSLVLKPWMIKKFSAWGALIDRFSQGCLQKVQRFLTYGFEVWFIIVDICCDNHGFDLLFSLAWEWISAREKHVCDYANTPNINFFVVSHFQLLISTNLDNFWSHIEGTTENKVEALLRIEKARKAEISNFYVQVIDVFWF